MPNIKISDLNTKAPKLLEKYKIKKETSKLAKKIQVQVSKMYAEKKIQLTGRTSRNGFEWKRWCIKRSLFRS